MNFPRRVIPFYEGLKKTIRPHEQVFYTVQGGDWGLACNAIHFIDILSFLTEETDYEVYRQSLDKSVKESKRALPLPKSLIINLYLKRYFHPYEI